MSVCAAAGNRITAVTLQTREDAEMVYSVEGS